MNPVAYKALYPIHVFDVSKQSERLTEGVVDLTVKIEFSANVPADTQSYALVIGDRMLQTVFTPLYLKNGRDYELAMVNLETYYSFANIRTGNNSLKWSGDGGTTWTPLHLPTSCYELMAINVEIVRMRGGNSDITILPNVNTLQCILNVVGTKVKVSFDVQNSLTSVLGFNKSIYGVGRHASEQLVNIMSVNSILIHCNIHSSYVRGVQAPVGCLQFLPKCRSWTEDTRSTKQFNLPPGNCIRYFNSVSVANERRRKGAGSTW